AWMARVDSTDKTRVAANVACLDVTGPPARVAASRVPHGWGGSFVENACPRAGIAFAPEAVRRRTCAQSHCRSPFSAWPPPGFSLDPRACAPTTAARRT